MEEYVVVQLSVPHTYIHTNIHTNIHTYIQTLIDGCSPRLFQHPVVVQLLELKWSSTGQLYFTLTVIYYAIILALFMVADIANQGDCEYMPMRITVGIMSLIAGLVQVCIYIYTYIHTCASSTPWWTSRRSRDTHTYAYAYHCGTHVLDGRPCAGLWKHGTYIHVRLHVWHGSCAYVWVCLPPSERAGCVCIKTAHACGYMHIRSSRTGFKAANLPQCAWLIAYILMHMHTYICTYPLSTLHKYTYTWHTYTHAQRQLAVVLHQVKTGQLTSVKALRTTFVLPRWLGNVYNFVRFIACFIIAVVPLLDECWDAHIRTYMDFAAGGNTTVTADDILGDIRRSKKVQDSAANPYHVPPSVKQQLSGFVGVRCVCVFVHVRYCCESSSSSRALLGWDVCVCVCALLLWIKLCWSVMWDVYVRCRSESSSSFRALLVSDVCALMLWIKLC